VVETFSLANVLLKKNLCLVLAARPIQVLYEVCGLTIKICCEVT